MHSATSRIVLLLARRALQLLVALCSGTCVLYLVVTNVPAWLQSSAYRAITDKTVFPFLPLALTASKPFIKHRKYCLAVRVASLA